MGYRTYVSKVFNCPTASVPMCNAPQWRACIRFYWLILALLNYFILLKLEDEGKYLAQIALYNNYLNARKKPFNYQVCIPKCFNFNLLISFKHSFETII